MTAYFIAQIDIYDPEEYQNYLAGFMPIFERYKGRLRITSSQKAEVIEGEWHLPRIVMMEFPDMRYAKNWLNDPDYQALARHRHRSAQTNLVLVEGVD